jgi:protein-disulfide isomerase
MNRALIWGLASTLTLVGCNDAGDKKAGTDGGSTATAIKAPAGANWMETFAKSAEGGMIMGNPAAPVKLVEYGALSCPVCAKFSVDSTEKLHEYVAKGTVSVEYRTFLIHPQDLPASLLARCNGPSAFFGISEQMFAKQDEWLSKSASITEADQQRWATLSPNGVAEDMAAKLDLVTFVQQRGVAGDKAKACLADPKGVTELEGIAKRANEEKVTGTPTFFINGVKVENITNWADLEPKLREAGA